MKLKLTFSLKNYLKISMLQAKLPCCKVKGTIMQIEKVVINDRLQKHPKNFAFQLFIILK